MNRRTNLKWAESLLPAALISEAWIYGLPGQLLMVAGETVPANRDEVDPSDRTRTPAARISACFSNSFSMGSDHSSGHAR